VHFFIISPLSFRAENNPDQRPSIFKNHGKSSRMSLPTRSLYHKNFPPLSGNKPFRTTPSKIDNKNKKTLEMLVLWRKTSVEGLPT
jgi:hypothetical protein